MSRYAYGDLILEAFIEFQRSMTIDEVVEYVAEMSDRSDSEVRLQVDNTLTAAWLHGFVERDNDLYSMDQNKKRLSRGSNLARRQQHYFR